MNASFPVDGRSDVTSRSVRSRDGTRIAYQTHGYAEEVFVLAPGLGFAPTAYRPLMGMLGDRFRFVTWHPRGTYDSEPAPTGHYRVGDHVADLEAIVEAENLTSFVLGGWSLAVQVSLEYAHRHREQCRALVLINGPYGELLRLRGLIIRQAARAMVAIARRQPRLIEQQVRLAFRRPQWVVGLLQAAGLMAKVEDAAFFVEVAQQFVQQPFGVLAETVAGADAHTSEAYLGTLRMPALVTVGSRDRLTPPRLGERLAHGLHDARWVQIRGGTHYTLLEYPDLIANAVAQFVSERLPRDTETSRRESPEGLDTP